MAKFINRTEFYKYMGEKELYKETGCLAPCNKVEN